MYVWHTSMHKARTMYTNLRRSADVGLSHSRLFTTRESVFKNTCVCLCAYLMSVCMCVYVWEIQSPFYITIVYKKHTKLNALVPSGPYRLHPLNTHKKTYRHTNTIIFFSTAVIMYCFAIDFQRRFLFLLLKERRDCLNK